VIPPIAVAQIASRVALVALEGVLELLLVTRLVVNVSLLSEVVVSDVLLEVDKDVVLVNSLVDEVGKLELRSSTTTQLLNPKVNNMRVILFIIQDRERSSVQWQA
jgi:nucleoside-triphosphatase THEP1